MNKKEFFFKILSCTFGEWLQLILEREICDLKFENH